MGSASAAVRSGPSEEDLDAVTLRRAQRGDQQAWRALIERYRHPVHALIWRMLAGRDRTRVDDLVQDTFVRVLRALASFDLGGPAKLSTWMLTIASRVVLNELRRAAARADHAPIDDRIELVAVDRADHASERVRIARAIASGVARLPDGQRAVFVLREYHELDYAEIASALEIDLDTVKSRLSRARAALRAQLAEVRKS